MLSREAAAFFDRLAGDWDCIAVHPRERVESVLAPLGDLAGRRVLDVGSGTGVLLPYLSARVGPSGRVLALDLAPRMIEESRRKHRAPNLAFEVADFLDWRSDEAFDALVAYSCFPHFDDPGAFWDSAARNLAPGGLALVAHIEGRERINAMHGKRAPGVSRLLPPAFELARLAEARGFEPLEATDEAERYLVLARRK
ncbi:MAG: class I SAM-dependent methyltransferase [Spirochaetaceae bacterium]|nr:class I SAM-dependent methyltransferase [Spirochaetaceae bacterium]